MEATVAIVMPIFPGEDHTRIRRAVHSVYMQTFQDWHLYMVYDGPCTPFIPLDMRRVTIVFAPRQGAGACRGQAIVAGDEPLIAYLDHDDLWYHEHLEVLVPEVKHHQFVFSKGLGFGECSYTRDEVYRQDGKRLYPPPYWNPVYLDRQNVTVTLAVMHTRALYNQVEGWRTEPLEDWRMWQRLSGVKMPVHVDRITCEYEVRDHGVTATGNRGIL